MVGNWCPAAVSLAALISVALTCPALAQNCDRLTAPASRAAQIGTAGDILAKIVNRLEVPPPDVARYIEEEQNAALENDSRSRLAIVMQNPFYHVVEVRRHYGVLNERMGAARDARSTADQVVALSDVLSRFGDLSSALSDYRNIDRQRAQPVLQPDVRRDIVFDLVLTKGLILRALQCGVRQMREP